MFFHGVAPSRALRELRDIWRRSKNQILEYKDVIWFPMTILLLVTVLFCEGGCQQGLDHGVRRII